MHPLGGEVGRLLGAPALAVDGGRRHRLGEAGAERGAAADVDRLLAHLVEAADDDVVHLAGVHPRPGDDLGEHLAEQVGRVPAGEHPLAPPHRGADGLDDQRLAHRAATPSRPANRGGRFSKKASIPSRWSSVVKARAKASTSLA